MIKARKTKITKHFSWLRAVLFGIVVFLVFAYAFLYMYMGNEKHRIGAQELMETVDAIAETLNQREYYLIPDTAYLVKLEPAFLRSENAQDSYPDQEMIRSTSDIKYNIEKGIKYNTLIHSVYLMLDDQTAPYVIENGVSVSKKDLTDTEWMQTCLSMDSDLMLQWREITLSYTRAIKVMTTYRRIVSTSWKDDSKLQGYLVVNYHYDSIISLLRAKLRYSETALLFNTDTGEYVTVSSTVPTVNTGMMDEVSAILSSDNTVKDNPLFLKDYGQMLYFETFDHTNIKIALLKENIQINRFLDNIRYIFALSISGLLALICLLYLYSYKQYRHYVKGIVRIINTLDEEDDANQIDILPKLSVPDPAPDSIYLIAHKLLTDTLDIYDLRNALQSEKTLRSEVEMLYSHAQINSHFLLNTLDSIYWASVQSRGAQAVESLMIENLCYILKYSLDASSMSASLREELTCAEKYIEIQRARRKTPIQVQWDIAEETLEWNVNKLIIQPILENSIQHGVRAKDAMEIQIHISTFEKNGYLHIRIDDNGRGLPRDVIAEMSEQFSENKPVKTRHIGMANVNRRLQVMYGNDCGIRLFKSPLGGLRSELILKKIL